jgi:hypothetical protein
MAYIYSNPGSITSIHRALHNTIFGMPRLPRGFTELPLLDGVVNLILEEFA